MKARLKQRGVLESTCALRAPTLINQYEQRRGHRSDGTTRTIMRVVPSLSHPLTESEDEVLTFLLAGVVTPLLARGRGEEQRRMRDASCVVVTFTSSLVQWEGGRGGDASLALSSCRRLHEGEGEEEGRARQ